MAAKDKTPRTQRVAKKAAVVPIKNLYRVVCKMRQPHLSMWLHDADFESDSSEVGYIRSSVLYLLSLGLLDLDSYDPEEFAASHGFMFKYIGKDELGQILA